MCDNSKYNRVNINKVDVLSGEIKTSVDYGFGYCINWEPIPFDICQNNKERYGAYLEDIICSCIDRISVLQVSKYNSEEYNVVKEKLFDALNILKEKAEE